MKIIKVPIFTAIFLSALLSFYGCQQENANENFVDDNVIISEYLSQLGYQSNDLEVNQTGISFDMDARMDRDFILAAANGNIPKEHDHSVHDSIEIQTRQRGVLSNEYYHAINIYYADQIDYYISESVSQDLGSVWVRAIESAADMWSEVSNCKIKLNKLSHAYGAEIYIASDNDSRLPEDMRNLPSDTWGKGDFPYYNRAGRYISFNANRRGFTYGQALDLALHEIGHNLGLHHTNRHFSSSSQIGTTPSSDDESVMNQGSSYLTMELSENDEIAIRTFYPKSIDATPEIISAGEYYYTQGSLIMIIKNDDYKQNPYYKVRIKKYSTRGYQMGFKDVLYDPYNADGWDQLWWSGFKEGESYLFSAQGLNFRGDVRSPESEKIRVDF